MDTRKRGIHSLPNDGLKYTTKQEITAEWEGRRSCPPCPPPPKVIRMKVHKGFGDGRTPPRAVFFTKPVSLSRMYNPDKDLSYLDQLFLMSSKIGEGSFGKVYKVRSREDNKIYAVKQMKSTHNLKYGFAEIENYEKVGDHLNCVQLVMAWEELKVVHIQMEYCQLSLAEYSSFTSNIQECQLWEILYDMLRALDHLHKKKLIHLDVKPDNIMISKGFYKLADFGLLVDLNEHSGRKISTISDGDAKYLACEVLDGIYTYACDIFGLGISILELATNIQLPTFGLLWHQIRKEPLPSSFYEVVTSHFATAIEQMMKSSHLQRPAADELLKTPELKQVCKRDIKEPRKNYCPNITDDCPLDHFIDDDNANNNIVETPRRPLYEVRNSWSRGSYSPRTPSESCRELREYSPPDICATRRGLPRIKLDF